jgi:hypothetical protein
MPKRIDRDRLRELHAAGKTPREMAAALGVVVNSLYPHLRSLGLLTRRVRPGAEFDRLTVEGPAGHDHMGRRLWRCRCSCGGSKDVAANDLTRLSVRSCGCLAVEARRATLDRVRPRPH